MKEEARTLGVFLVGTAPPYLAAILAHPGLRLAGQVPRFTMMLPLLRDCPADVLLFSRSSLDGWPLDQAVPRVRDINPGLLLAVLLDGAGDPPHVEMDWVFENGAVPEVVAAQLAAGPAGPAPPDPPAQEVIQPGLLRLFARAPQPSFPPTPAVPDEEPRMVPPALLAVCGPKGGVGKTTVAVGLASILARLSRGSTALVDLDLQGADVGAHLDLLDGPTLVDALPYASESQGERAIAYLQEHRPTGMRVFLGPPRPDLAEVVQGEGTGGLVRLLRRRFPFVILDAPAGTGDMPDYLLGADRFLLVTTLDPPSLRRCRIWLDALGQRHPEAGERVVVVANRVRPGQPVLRHQAEDFLGLPIRVEVPEDGPAASRALEAGVPAAVGNPGSSLAVGLVKLAQVLGLLTGSTVPPQAWLTRWIRR